MPQGDRTGPMGQGSRTGRALGFCTGNNTPGFAKGFGGGMGIGFGFGRGHGRGMGSGRGRNFGGAFTGFFQSLPWTQSIGREDEAKMLKAQAESLKRSQKEIEKRLAELENEND